jgi:large repetitive protein
MKQSYRLLVLFVLLFVQTITARPISFDPPTATVNDNTICQGTSVTLTATGTGTITWHITANGSDPEIGTGATLAVTPTTTTTYYAKDDDGMSNGVLVTVYERPTVTIAEPVQNACSGTSILFDSTITGGTGPYQYEWTFSDGGSSTDADPSHTFISLGCGSETFTAILVVTDAHDCTRSATKSVIVKQRPDVDFFDNNATPANQFNNCSNAAISPIFNVTVGYSPNSSCISSYSINWGDGGGVINNISLPLDHTYTVLGTYNLTITAHGQNGCNTTKTFVVKNVSNPSGGISSPGNTQNLCTPTAQLQFSISNWALNSPGTTYAVNFGDGTTIENYTQEQLIASVYYNTAIPSTSLNYPIPHSYTTTSCPNNQFIATLTVTNACGFTTGTIANISTLSSPTPNFTNPASACVNTSVLFTNTTTMGYDTGCSQFTKYVWNFGDGSSSETVNYIASTPNRTHTYTTPGIYTITLSTQNTCATTIKTNTICIEAPLPSASFTLNNTVGCGSLTAVATNTTPTANTCNVTYNWAVAYTASNCGSAPANTFNYFTNGTTATSANPSFNFPNPGTYTVTLTAHNACGDKTATQTVTVKAPPTVAISAIPDVCGGSSATISPTATVTNCGSTAPTYLWSFPGGTPSTSTAQNPTGIAYNTPGSKTVTLTVTNECGPTTDTENFTVTPTVLANAGTDPTICSGSSTTLSGLGSGGSGSGYTYQWALASNPTNTLSSSQTYSVSPSATTTYTVKVTNGSCVTTDDVTVFVNTVAPGTIGSSQTLCSGADPAAFTASTPATGAGTLTYQWESSTAAATGPYTDVSGAMAATYDAPVVTQATWYRRKVTSTLNNITCTATTTAPVQITINTITAADISGTQTVCTGGNPIAFTAPAATGGGTITYQWQSSTDNVTFTNISGETAAVYDAPSLTQTTHYKRVATSTLSGTPCILESNALTVTVIPLPVITTQPLASQTICQSAVPTTLQVVAQGGTGTLLYEWHVSSSPSGSSNTILSAATQDNFVPPTTATGTQYYFCVVHQAAPGCSVTSSIVQVTVITAPSINQQPASSTVCVGGTPALLSVAYQNGTASPTYQWFSNTTATTSGGAPITAATSATYQPQATTEGVQYYYAVITFPSGGCSFVTSALATVTVNPLPQITTQPMALQSICVGGSISTLTVAGNSTSGTAAYQWYSNTSNATTGGTFIAGATAASYTPPAYNTAGTYYYYAVITYSNNGCGSVTSTIAQVTVVPDPVITTQPTATQSLCQNPLANPISVVATGGSGTLLYQWYSNTSGNASGGTLITGAANAAYTPAATTVGTAYYYCVITTAASGCLATSNVAQVIVLAAPTVSTQPQPQTLCFGATSALLTTAYSNGTGTPAYQWYSNTVNNIVGGAAINGATNAAYQPSGAAPGIIYYYLQITFNTGGCSVITSDVVAVTINPLPNIATPQTATICSGDIFSVTPQPAGNNLPAGTQYTWTVPANADVTGESSVGTLQNTVSQTLTNTTNAPVTVIYSVTPSANGCPGTPFNVTVTVNPKPFVVAQTSTICSGEPFSIAPANGGGNIVPAGTTYSWAAPTLSGGIINEQAGTNAAAITGTLTNTTNTAQTATYTVTPKWTLGTQTCTGNTFSVTVTVNPKPAVNTINIPTCSGVAFTVTPADGTNGTIPTGTVYTWAAPAAITGISGLAAGSGNSITGILTNNSNAAIQVAYVVTPVANGCAGSAFNVVVTVQPTPTVAAIANQTVCNGLPITAITFTSPVTGTTFAWTNNNTTIGLAASGSTDIASFPAINNGTTAVTATIIVTPSSGTCTGAPQTFTITVNPAPSVTFSQANQTICSGSASSSVNLSSTTSGAAITWTATQPAGITGVTTSGTTTIPVQTLINSTNAPIVVTYSATAATTGVACPGAAYLYTITVNPKPNITTPQNETICSGDTFTITPSDGGANIVPAGTQYTWTVPANADITGESSIGTLQNSISQTLTNTTNAPVVVTYIVTPSANGCPGATFPVTVTVNPKPFVVTQTNTICSGEPFSITPANGGGNIVPSGTTYSWAAPAVTGGITGGGPGTDAASIGNTLGNPTNTAQTATYTVTPKWTLSGETCNGDTFTITVTVNPKPAITSLTATSCSGIAFTVTPADGTNGAIPSGTQYTWAAPATIAGISGLAAGSGSSITGTLTNTNTAAVTVNYTVTPTSGACTGAAFTVAVLVAPTPTVATIANQTVCNGSPVSAINFVGTVTGTTFNWVNNTPSIGLAASGVGNITSFNAINTGITPVTATITVTPEITGCFGTAQTFTITVNPAPSVTFSPAANQTICSGSASTVVNLSSSSPNTTITWVATIPAGINGATANGTTTIPVQTLVNNTSAALTVTYTATASTADTSACQGAPSVYTITVTPVPFVNGTPQISSCSGISLNYIPANSGGNNMPAGVTFTWAAPAGSGFTGGSAQNTPQPSLNQTLVNTTNAPVTATYSITPHYNGCDGVPFTVIVTINPVAIIPNATLTLCSGAAFSFNPATVATLLPASTVYNWSAPTGTVSGGASGSAQSLITGTLNNTSATAQTATYTITPVSPNGSCAGAPFTLTATVNPVFAVTNTVSNYNGFQISSAGASDAYINLSPTGGTGTYTYSWTGPNSFTASTQNITNIGPGTYTVVISDGLCSNITITVTIVEPLPLIIEEVVASHVDVDCFGQSTGIIEVAVTTVSIAPFDYAILLPNGTVVENVDNLTALNYVFDNLPAGTYNIRVTDANGTIKFINGIQITQPASGLAITNAVITNFNGFSISCNGSADAAIDLTVSGGYPAYTYSWSGPNGFTATTEDIANLNPGTYTVTILDTTNACPVAQSYTISEPAVVAFTGTVPQFSGFEVSCFGGTNGSISITPSGGTSLYTYAWTGPNGFTAASQNITNLSIGTYQLTMSDSNGCTASVQSFTLTEPTALAIAETHVNVLCFGAATGAIDVSVTGGITNGAGTYTFAWTGPGGFTSAAEDLITIVAGTYTLLVTDANGCTIPLSVTVTQQPEIIIIPTTTPITCYGADNASISLAITGGDPPYTAAWSNLATGTYQDNLGAGTYVITVTDESGCVKPINVVIPQAPVFMVTPTFSNISCHGAHDGNITLNLVGGIAPVTLVWSDGSTAGTTRNNLAAGTYTATITDGTPCQIIRTFTIIEPAALTVTASLTHALDCDDATTGAINLLVAGGTPPYTYAWSNGQTTEDLTAITSGTYSVTITDAGSCTATGTYTITRPDPLVLNVTSNVVFSCTNHTVVQTNIAQAAGGVPPFTYTWSSGTVTGGQGQFMNTNQNGTVIVTATDAYGCTTTANFDVETQQLGEANFTAGSYAFTTYQEYSILDPVQFDNLSTGDYTEVGWDFGDGGSSNEFSPSHTYLREGTYTVTLHVVYPYGCSDTYHITIEVTKGYDVMVPNAFTPNADGSNDTFNAVHKGLKEITLDVFDTWGALIYSEKGDVITGWNGFVKGNAAENGNFYYRIKAETFYGQVVEFNGPFVLIK